MENITPKEKAIELIEKYSFIEIAYYTSMFEVKQCAIIAVEEIIIAVDWNKYKYPNMVLEYWEKVKQEIEKI